MGRLPESQIIPIYYAGQLWLCVCVLGCGRSPAETTAVAPLAVVVSGDTEGWLVPCGCTSNQSGGLPRRATLVSQLRERSEVILADAGGAPRGTSEYDRWRCEAILRGEAAMGISAHNVGRAELALGIQDLRRLGEVTGVPWLSANICGLDGEPIFAESLVLSAAGRRVALIGLIAEQFATDEVDVIPPAQSISHVLRRLDGSFDHLIILAYLPEDQLRELAEMTPEADLVIGGPTGQPVPPQQIGPVLLTSATHQGKFLAIAEQFPDNGPDWSARIVELDDTLADDTVQLANLQQFYERLAEEDIAADQTSFAPSGPSAVADDWTVAGTDACRECHEQDDLRWRESGHAHAWRSLQTGGTHVDPACQRCHTVGFGLPGGFVSVLRSRDRVDVGCECCHGPSAAHVQDPDQPTAFAGQAASQCVNCHDRENSPNFEYESYWEKIQHGM